MTTDVDLSQVYPRPSWPPIDPARLALVVVDLQVLCAVPGHGMFARAEELGRPELLEPYAARLREVVVPNVARLVRAFRRRGAPIVFTRIQSRTDDGRDRSGCHRRLGLHVAPGSVDGEFVAGLEPEPGDVVVSKTTSDAFIGTGLDQLLHNLGTSQLAVCGVLTHECVESTVRHAADLGFVPLLIEDGCAAVEQDRHDAAVRNLGLTYARVVAAADLLDVLAPADEAVGPGS